MSRIRTIKPEFFTSEDIVALSSFGRLLYIALWCEADRKGRLQWKPRTFKIRYFPADDIDIDGLCDEIIGLGLVVTYGAGYALIPSFGKHQHINPRESESNIPDPTEEELDASLTGEPRVTYASARVENDDETHASTTREPRVTDASLTRDDASVTRREEGKGKERNNNTGDGYAADFLDFWDRWPGGHGEKGSKSEAAKAWRKVKSCRPSTDSLVASAQAQAASKRAAQRDGLFAPPFKHVCRWLVGREWETEVPVARLAVVREWGK